MAPSLIFHHIPGTTPLHRINPRWKLIAYLAVSPLAMVSPPLYLGGLTLLTFALYIWIRLSPVSILKEARPLWVLAIILLTFRTLSNGIESGMLETTRFAWLIFWTHLFLASTSTGDIRKAIGSFLQILPKNLGKRIGLALSITLLLFPLFLDLSREILDAMTLRQFGSNRSFLFITKRFLMIFLRKAFRMAGSLSQALEMRGFQ
ncbi:MAG: energy-coupling factor transporter transmembrane protein EcfT [Spirochaetes bacterium]|nr:energy-coupling factor transporter transmembrane protein EcfT [Spirochaetota bacterium]